MMQGREEENKIFEKVKPMCKRCEVEMIFMFHKFKPNDERVIAKDIKCCGDFEQYDYMKCGTLKAMDYAFYHEDITQNEFYFYCAQCAEYALCAGCCLAEYEVAKKEKEKKEKKEVKSIKFETVEQERDYWKR